MQTSNLTNKMFAKLNKWMVLKKKKALLKLYVPKVGEFQLKIKQKIQI